MVWQKQFNWFDLCLFLKVHQMLMCNISHSSEKSLWFFAVLSQSNPKVYLQSSFWQQISWSFQNLDYFQEVRSVIKWVFIFCFHFWKEDVQSFYHVTLVTDHQAEQTRRLWRNNFNFSLPSGTALIALQFSKRCCKKHPCRGTCLQPADWAQLHLKWQGSQTRASVDSV